MTPRQLGAGLVLLALILGLAGLSRQAQGAPAAAATLTAGPTKTQPPLTPQAWLPFVASRAAHVQDP